MPTRADSPVATDAVPHDPALDKEVLRLGTELIERARKKRAGLLSAAFWSDKLMDWAMKDEAFKVQLFRFVDAFPRLKTPQQVHDHLVDSMSQPGVTMPPGLGVGLKAGGLLKGAMTRTLTGQITSMAEKFIGGRNAKEARSSLRKLWSKGVGFSVDLLGEASVSAREAETYQQKYLDLVRELPPEVAEWPNRPLLEADHLGPIPRTNVSVKISSLLAKVDPIDTAGAIDALVEVLAPILDEAVNRNVFVNFDIEQHELKDLTLELFMRCCEESPFEAGIALQAYLRSGEDDARRLIEWARGTGRLVTVRLVKGAYWDFETINAEEMGWPIPVWSRKPDTDACFERMTRQFVESMPRDANEGGVRLALGSHNARSIAYALALLERHDLPTSALELQMLHGMGDALKTAAVEMDLRVREYMPVGEMIPGMAYLVRRLLENTSNQSWLRAGFAENIAAEKLLASPHRTWSEPDPGRDRIEKAAHHHALGPAVEGVGDERPFTNEPPRNFASRDVREAFARAIARTEAPAVGAEATEESADRAVATAADALPAWRAADPRQRADVLVHAARILRRRHDELAGILIREAGKTWRDADVEVCEAIDYCEYYAREAIGFFEPRRLGRFVGELNQVVHQARGVAVVISPWNFPLSLLAGMTVAALVTGNPTIVKPAEATVGIARAFCDILAEAGCPPAVLQLLAGPGPTVGAALARDPRVAIIAFTGSASVGQEIIAAAGARREGRRVITQVIAEMGGKNAVIVDASADLDEAVLAVRGSAFGFQGQKCSACSRAIVHEACYDAFLDRLCAATESMRIGDPVESGVGIGPVIDFAHKKSIEAFIEIGKAEARLALAMELPDPSRLAPGRDYVAPHIFAEVPPKARIATEEILGPVLAVTRAEDFVAALDLANASAYGLNGGVYSRRPSNLQFARREFRVGNLYLNRPITGARVGRQPWGGFRLSGSGTKSGGPDYLLHFVEPRCISENTMRSGFAPEL
ncbi:MAG: bifunctional proline dehydrogenase/L-glutamate gamma-semialdehyde dehydrogenase [Planctomycetes bacterium]|nr:bifunctional proline dehydrogenase/L-glutamate gamma-semialdehyde dehydrogenase [Planctomycetota bacterium]